MDAETLSLGQSGPGARPARAGWWWDVEEELPKQQLFQERGGLCPQAEQG